MALAYSLCSNYTTANNDMAHKPLNTFHLFAGAGGGILADLLLGHNPIGAAEIEKYPREVLLARQRDGHLPNFPIWDDVATLDGNPWRGSVDVLCGGFPCQDISAAGKGAGITGERSGLWKEYARLIGEMRPRFVFAENSPLLRTRGLGVVLEDLAALGYNARWGIIGAGDVGAPHKRARMWVLAYSKREQDDCQRGISQRRRDTVGREEQAAFSEDRKASSNCLDGQDKKHLAYTDVSGDGASRCSADIDGAQIIKELQIKPQSEPSRLGDACWRTDPAEGTAEPVVGRVAHGLANRVGRLKALGNGQVPSCAAVAFNILAEGLI